MRAKATAIVFIALIFLLTISNLIWPDKVYSENENRYLAQMPEFSITSLADGSYTKALEEYLTDQFPLRDNWVGLKTLAELSIGKKESGGVYIAKDGYLIEQFSTLDEEQYQKNLEAVAAFTEQVEQAYGITVQTMLVPTASCILREKLPTFTPELSQTALLEQAEQAGLHLVNVTDALMAHSQDYIYYRTDHHWTSLGAYIGYDAWQKSLSNNTKSLDQYSEEVLSDQFLGTTYSKANLYIVQPDTILGYYEKDHPVEVTYNLGEQTVDSIYERSYLSRKDKYSVFLNGNQSVTKIVGQVKNGKRLLLIKDSYANTFAQFALTDYEEVHLIDLRYYKRPVMEYMQENQITEVLVLYNLKGFSEDKDVTMLKNFGA